MAVTGLCEGLGANLPPRCVSRDHLDCEVADQTAPRCHANTSNLLSIRCANSTCHWPQEWLLNGDAEVEVAEAVQAARAAGAVPSRGQAQRRRASAEGEACEIGAPEATRCEAVSCAACRVARRAGGRQPTTAIDVPRDTRGDDRRRGPRADPDRPHQPATHPRPLARRG